MKLIRAIHSILKNNTSPINKGNGCNYIFIHINKTGGTSIDKSLGISVKKHLTAKQIIDIVGEKKWKESFKFTFVRNPWDKVVSHYKYRVKTNQTNLKEKNISFAEWVKKTYGKNKDSLYYDNPQMFYQQTDWLKDNNGKIDIDFIGKFENMNNDFKYIQKKIKIFNNLPHLNKTVPTNYKDFYTEKELIDIINDAFKEDIKLFNYTFE